MVLQTNSGRLCKQPSWRDFPRVHSPSAFVFVCMVSRLLGNLSVFIHMSQLNFWHTSWANTHTPPGRFHLGQPLHPLAQLVKWPTAVCLGACLLCGLCLCDRPLLVGWDSTALFRAFVALEGKSVIRGLDYCVGVGVGGCVYVCFKVKDFLACHRVHPQCTICASRSFDLCSVYFLSPPSSPLSSLSYSTLAE